MAEIGNWSTDDPEGFNQDLHPGPIPAQQIEKLGDIATAYDVKDVHRRLQSFTDDELKAIPILPPGTRLEQGATYIDLREREPKEFTATGQMVSGENNWYVPKSEVDYVLWNHLIGVDNPERLDEAD
jgi:hypothetical protein